MRAVLIMGLLVVLSACATTEQAVRYDPKTGKVVGCKTTAGGGLFPFVNNWSAQEDEHPCSAPDDQAKAAKS